MLWRSYWPPEEVIMFSPDFVGSIPSVGGGGGAVLATSSTLSRLNVKLFVKRPFDHILKKVPVIVWRFGSPGGIGVTTCVQVVAETGMTYVAKGTVLQPGVTKPISSGP